MNAGKMQLIKEEIPAIDKYCRIQIHDQEQARFEGFDSGGEVLVMERRERRVQIEMDLIDAMEFVRQECVARDPFITYEESDLDWLRPMGVIQTQHRPLRLGDRVTVKRYHGFYRRDPDDLAANIYEGVVSDIYSDEAAGQIPKAIIEILLLKSDHLELETRVL